MAVREEFQNAADLVSRPYLRERIAKGHRQPLTLHADNGNAMRSASLESRLEELGVLRSFSRLRVSNHNPCLESLFGTVKYRPNDSRRPFHIKHEACEWMAGFVDWYHQDHHSGIRDVMPAQRRSGQAIDICRHRARLYKQAQQRHLHRWSRGTRCWNLPAMVWIYPPPPENALDSAPLVSAACCGAGASSFLAEGAQPAQVVQAWPIAVRGAGSSHHKRLKPDAPGHSRPSAIQMTIAGSVRVKKSRAA